MLLFGLVYEEMNYGTNEMKRKHHGEFKHVLPYNTLGFIKEREEVLSLTIDLLNRRQL